MNIKTTRFGEIDVPAECIIEFKGGLPGFPEEEKFALFPYEPDSPFSLLQSILNPDLTFLLTDPYRFFNDYAFELDDRIAVELGFSTEVLPQVYVVATMRESLEKMTVNLQAPIVVNWNQRTGVQLIMESRFFSVKQPLFPEGIKLTPKTDGRGG